MLLQKHLQIATRAHYGTSHVPETRGEQYVKEFSQQLSEDLEKVAKLGGDPADYQTRYERLFVAWMYAKGRCLSSMITGPSGFPVRKAQKANDSERKHGEAFFGFREKYFARLERNQRREAKAASDPVQEMRRDIERAEAQQAAMIAANKIIRQKGVNDAEKIEGLQKLLGWSEAKVIKLMEPDFAGRIGFPDYALTNNSANIRRMRERLAELEAKAQATTEEITREDGIRIVKNTDADRLQIFFPGKPAPEMIGKLKSRAFKWSPSQGCWQRQLTNNAIHAMREVLQ